MVSTIITIYQFDQIKKLQYFLKDLNKSEKENIKVVALRADVERELEKLSIEFESGKSLRTVNPADNLEYAENLVQNIVKSKDFSFWKYKNIPLGKIRSIVLQDYFSILLYWLDIFYQINKKWSPKKVIIWKIDTRFMSRSFLQDEYSCAVTTAASLVCKAYDVKLDLRSLGNFPNLLYRRLFFFVKRTGFTFFLRTVNFLVFILQKKRSSRVLITDSWRNTVSYAEYMKDTEFIFYDRLEIFRVGWKNIFKYRVRFISAEVYEKLKHKIIARIQSLEIKKIWNSLDKKNIPELNPVWRDISLQPVLDKLLKRLICDSYVDDVVTIEATEDMLKALRPTTVVVRASASRQTHFSFLCCVAKKLSVPSFEPQHGLFYLGPGSVPKNSVVENLATYGSLSSRELVEAGFKGRVIDVGSPRFDEYVKIATIQQTNDVFTILFVLPDDTTGAWFDTYDIDSLLDSVSVLASEESKIQIILKARAGAAVSSYGYLTASEKFKDIKNVTVVNRDSLPSLLLKSSVVVSVFSTILVESIAAHRPTIYWAQKGFHQSLVKTHLHRYIKYGSVHIAYSENDIFEQIHLLKNTKYYLSQKKIVESFAKNNFSFDKGSSSRFAKLILSQAKL